MKKNYESPIIEIIEIGYDIMTDSGTIPSVDIPDGDPYAM